MEPINWHSFFFFLFALVSCAFAVAVVLSSNIVRMAFYLVISLGATAGLFFLAGADFVGAMQLLIYVGGTLVLLVFGVMLTAQGPFVSMKTRGGDWILAAVLSGSLLALLVPAAFTVPEWRRPVANNAPTQVQSTSTPLGLGLLGVRVDKLEERPERLKAGMSSYLLPFEIVSVHLLVVLVGAAYLARTKRRRDVRLESL
ncbi:MAG TPA: NADH-quinone oxidoreductase subunit J [Pirellulales bacterium]|nr:NADH-quinone oxidoreductase subunit J [Pirellulales bacterium]HVA51424.1 NADH-quinone oxidoreductase subunit J [Pirellulales bacterium]